MLNKFIKALNAANLTVFNCFCLQLRWDTENDEATKEVML